MKKPELTVGMELIDLSARKLTVTEITDRVFMYVYDMFPGEVFRAPIRFWNDQFGFASMRENEKNQSAQTPQVSPVALDDELIHIETGMHCVVFRIGGIGFYWRSSDRHHSYTEFKDFEKVFIRSLTAGTIPADAKFENKVADRFISPAPGIDPANDLDRVKTTFNAAGSFEGDGIGTRATLRDFNDVYGPGSKTEAWSEDCEKWALSAKETIQQQSVREYFASLGVPDGIVPGDEVVAHMSSSPDKISTFIGVNSGYFVCAFEGQLFEFSDISRPGKHYEPIVNKPTKKAEVKPIVSPGYLVEVKMDNWLSFDKEPEELILVLDRVVPNKYLTLCDNHYVIRDEVRLPKQENPSEKSAREEAQELLKKHWEKLQIDMTFNKTVENHLSYAIDAIEEALTKNQK